MVLFVILRLLDVLVWLIIIRAVVSWFVSPYSPHPLVQLLHRVTDPILRPIARRLPSAGGMDLSPLVAILLIYLVQMLLMRLVY